MSHIKLDITDLHFTTFSLSRTPDAIAKDIREMIRERGITVKQFTKMCDEAATRLGILQVCNEHNFTHFFGGKMTKPPLNLLIVMLAVLGFDLCAVRAEVRAGAINVIEDGLGEVMALPKRPKRDMSHLQRYQFKKEGGK